MHRFLFFFFSYFSLSLFLSLCFGLVQLAKYFALTNDNRHRHTYSTYTPLEICPGGVHRNITRHTSKIQYGIKMKTIEFFIMDLKIFIRKKNVMQQKCNLKYLSSNKAMKVVVTFLAQHAHTFTTPFLKD